MQDMMLGLMIAALISEIFVDSIALAVFFLYPQLILLGIFARV